MLHRSPAQTNDGSSHGIAQANDATLLMLNARAAVPLRYLPRLTRSTATTTKHVADNSPPPRLQPLPPRPQPTVTSERGHRTLRRRQHGNQSLPLPPLLDPIATRAKDRYTAAKPADNGDEKTDFQTQLASNPYALALATPIRQCHLTRAILPSHFLQPFSALISASAHDPSPTLPRNPPSRSITASLVPEPKSDLPHGTTLPTSTYALNSRRLLEHLGKKRAWARLAHQRMQDAWARRTGRKGGKGVDVGGEWVWDPETAGVVLAQRRRRVVAHFLRLSEGEGDVGGVGPVSFFAELPAPGRGAVGALLYRRAPGESGGRLGGDVPVYILEDLLGPEEGEAVLERLDSEGCRGCVVYQDRELRRSVPLLLALHRLAMYLGGTQQFR